MTDPTDPAISIATPPKRCSSEARKRWAQSEDTQRFCSSSAGVPPLKPSVSTCWLTLASVTIARLWTSTASSTGIRWSSTYG